MSAKTDRCSIIFLLSHQEVPKTKIHYLYCRRKCFLAKGHPRTLKYFSDIYVYMHVCKHRYDIYTIEHVGHYST